MIELAPIAAFTRTDNGRVHDHNEDYISSWEPPTPDAQQQHGWLYVVADGVGGADAGEIASEFATEKMKEHYLANVNEEDWGQRLRQAMLFANTELRQYVASEYEGRRMATTMVSTVIINGAAHIANVGDSRAYHWRAGTIAQITKDQSLVAKLVEEGAISAAEAENHPYQNVILYSIGSDKNPRIDLFEVPLVYGDILVLCSDGLTKHVTDAEIGEFVQRQELAMVAGALVDLANERGGRDNISVAVIRYGQRPDLTDTMALTPPTAVSDVAPMPAKTLVAQPVSQPSAATGRRALWVYTLFLALIQTILTILVWLFLRV